MGTYVLALWLDAPCQISVGRLGEFRFPAGWYLYVGSAFGPGGLRARLARHRRRVTSGKRAHWHVDYLREWASWGGAWGHSSEQRLECTWAAALLRLPGARVVASRFGASDCRCPAHLVHLPALPGEHWFQSVLGADRYALSESGHPPVVEMRRGKDERARRRVGGIAGNSGLGQ